MLAEYCWIESKLNIYINGAAGLAQKCPERPVPFWRANARGAFGLTSQAESVDIRYQRLNLLNMDTARYSIQTASKHSNIFQPFQTCTHFFALWHDKGIMCRWSLPIIITVHLSITCYHMTCRIITWSPLDTLRALANSSHLSRIPICHELWAELLILHLTAQRCSEHQKDQSRRPAATISLLWDGPDVSGPINCCTYQAVYQL